MKLSKISKRIIFLSFILGLLFASGSIIIGSTGEYSGCNDWLASMDRGFPRPFLHVEAADDRCNPLENVGAIFEPGIHNSISMPSYFLDVVIWSVAAGATISFLLWVKQELDKRRTADDPTIIALLWSALLLQALLYVSLLVITYFGLVYSDFMLVLVGALWCAFLAISAAGLALAIYVLVNRQKILIPRPIALACFFVCTTFIALTAIPTLNWAGYNGHYDHMRHPDWHFCEDTGACD